MSNLLIVVIMLLGFFSVSGLFLYLTTQDAAKRRKNIEASLFALGFEHCSSAEEKQAVAQHLHIVNPCHNGNRLLMHLYVRKNVENFSTYVCDYRFASASGKGWGAEMILVCIVSQELDMPHLIIDTVPASLGAAATFYKKLCENFPLPGLKRIKTEKPLIDSDLYIYAKPSDKQAALDTAEKISQNLLATGDICVNAKGNILILSSFSIGADKVRQKTSPDKILRLIGISADLFDRVRARGQAG